MPSESDGGDARPDEQPSGGSSRNRRQNDDNDQRGGNSSGNRRRGNRNRRNFRNRRQQQRLQGREPALRDHIFDLSSERNADQYLKTVKELVNHVGRTREKYTSELTQGVINLELDDPIEPVAPPEDNRVAFEMWRLDLREHKAKVQEYENFRSTLYNLVLGQCTEVMQDRLRSHEQFPAANQDGIALLRIIRGLMYSFEERQKLSDALCDVREKFYNLRQGRYQSLRDYYDAFVAQVAVMNEVGIAVADDSLVAEVATENGRDVPDEADFEEAKEQALTARFLRGTNAKYRQYLRDLRNNYLDGNDYYPTTVHDAYNILQRREIDNPVHQWKETELRLQRKASSREMRAIFGALRVASSDITRINAHLNKETSRKEQTYVSLGKLSNAIMAQMTMLVLTKEVIQHSLLHRL